LRGYVNPVILIQIQLRADSVRSAYANHGRDTVADALGSVVHINNHIGSQIPAPHDPPQHL